MFKINPYMQYRNLGNTGLIVSCLAFGNSANDLLSYQQNKAIVQKCLECGINFFDTAEVYWGGEAQTSFGNIFKELGTPRQQIVVATKILTAKNPSINSTFNTNRKHIKESTRASLERLQMDYVDVIYAHIFDESSSIQQICRGFYDVIEDGLAFYWAVSNWEADSIFEAMRVCEQFNLHKPICGQIHYNMVVRQKGEADYERLLTQYGFKIVSYNTLLGGYLTGKYLCSDVKGRFTTDIPEKKIEKSFWKNSYYDYIDFKELDGKLEQLKELAEKELNCTLAHLAIGWSVSYKNLSSALLGARNPSQIQDSVGALKLLEKLTPETLGRIDKILGTDPQPRYYWKNYPNLTSINLRNNQ